MLDMLELDPLFFLFKKGSEDTFGVFEMLSV